jgi:SAM-dependent methyltransferase
MVETISQEWWRDPRSHFGELKAESPMLSQRKDIQPAVEFIYSQLGLLNGAALLDLCCGPGRYSVGLAHKGFEVVGLELNQQYVTLARQVAAGEQVATGFLAGDMRSIPFVNHFDAVINVGTSFGFFDREAEDQQVIESVARSLKPGGQREFDYVRSRINSTFEVLADGDTEEKWSHSWRAYALVEIAAMLEQAGLILSHTFGNWNSGGYDVDSPRMIVVSKNGKA